jgi:hypothetical protein
MEIPEAQKSPKGITFTCTPHQSPMLQKLVKSIAMKMLELKRCANAWNLICQG